MRKSFLLFSAFKGKVAMRCKIFQRSPEAGDKFLALFRSCEKMNANFSVSFRALQNSTHALSLPQRQGHFAAEVW